MPLKKQYLKSKPVVKVTFEVSPEAADKAEKIYLLSESNQWQPIELKKFKNGKFKTTINVDSEAQSEYQFKYQFEFEDGSSKFENDWEADRYQANEHGSENSVLQV